MPLKLLADVDADSWHLQTTFTYKINDKHQNREEAKKEEKLLEPHTRTQVASVDQLEAKATSTATGISAAFEPFWRLFLSLVKHTSIYLLFFFFLFFGRGGCHETESVTSAMS
jgi:hypothetical protein